MMPSLMAGDVVVFDRYYCSFMMIALLLNQKVDVCARLHHLRRADFRKGHRLGKYDHLSVWTRPDRPAWMNERTYATIPETLELRELRYAIVECMQGGLMSQAALQKECDELLKRIAECRVGDRPGRLEPRVIKPRRHGYPLMQKPRDVLRAELRKHCT